MRQLGYDWSTHLERHLTPERFTLPRSSFQYISDASQLRQLCEDLAGVDTIAFDTEFVSEDTYRPQLCLIQVAAADRLAIIDPQAVGDVTPFWHLLSEPGHSTVVHAGREELLFCVRAIDRRPHGWFDTQLAAGFAGLEFPAAYHNLVGRLLDQPLRKGETRTDWRRRPLSQRQLDYALQDVEYLEALRRVLLHELEALERLSWFDEEQEAWLRQVEQYDAQEQWHRVSGISGLSRRALAIVRELWRWRESEALERNKPPRRILRDDLIVELARRESSDVRRIRAVRGLEYGKLKSHLPVLAERIECALSLPGEELPCLPRNKSNPPSFTLLGQFLNTALGCVCRSARLAPTLVGTVQDVRAMIAYRLETPRRADVEPPALLRGWRAEVIGRQLDEVLQGRLAMRVAEQRAEQPLEFVAIAEPRTSGE